MSCDEFPSCMDIWTLFLIFMYIIFYSYLLIGLSRDALTRYMNMDWFLFTKQSENWENHDETLKLNIFKSTSFVYLSYLILLFGTDFKLTILAIPHSFKMKNSNNGAVYLLLKYSCIRKLHLGHIPHVTVPRQEPVV